MAKPALLFLLAGGRGMRISKGPDPILRSVFDCKGIRKPSIAYVGAASGDNPEFRLWIAELLRRSGAGKVTLAPLCGKHGDPEKAKRVLEVSDLVFMSGGDVEEGMRVLREKEMTGHLQRLYREGKVFFGTSAGSIILARQWIRWEEPDDEGSASLFNCLGLAPIVCDTHGEDDGWEELKALLGLSQAGTIGYGIVSGAALRVNPEGAVSAMGGEVHRFQKQNASVTQIESLFPVKAEQDE